VPPKATFQLARLSVARGSILHLSKLLFAMLGFFAAAYSADLPTRKFVNFAAIKTMVAAAEAKTKKLNVGVTICIVDESGNLFFLPKADAAPLNTIEFAQKKARHVALFKIPSKDGADAVKKGHLDVLVFPDFFPTRADSPARWTARPSAVLLATGAKSEIDEAISQAALDALFNKK
jgi:glc operon protein GlcG